MNDFKSNLRVLIKKSVNNNYGIENYDSHRFGYYQQNLEILNKKKSVFDILKIKKFIKNGIGYKTEKQKYLKIGDELTNNYIQKLNTLWVYLSQKDQELVVSLTAYRILGFKKVKLKRNDKTYWDALEKVNTLANKNQIYNPNFLHFILFKFNLASIGYNIKLYFSEVGIVMNYVLEQYAYKINDLKIVAVENGDTVLDIGACWGDTALYFAEKAGTKGRVFSFEFIPENIKLFRINTALNPDLIERITLIESPVSHVSGDLIHYKDNGPGSKVLYKPFDEQTGTSTTLSIDDFMELHNVQRVDFIKMDIEGAEPDALIGAIKTITKFKPKLAIAIYHSFDDFVNIPNWILSLDLGYEIFIDHFTIHGEETICFAKIKSVQ